MDIPFLKKLRPSKPQQQKRGHGSITDDQIEMWKPFRGRGNSHAILVQKASVLAQLIEMSADLGFEVAEMMQANQPDLCLRSEQRHRSRLEGIAFALRLVHELAHRELGRDQSDRLMGAIEEVIVSRFSNDLMLPDQLFAFFQEKYEDYGAYNRWVDSDPGQGATLFWEFAKRQAHLIGIGKSAIYNTMLTTMLLRQVSRWGVDNLLQP